MHLLDGQPEEKEILRAGFFTHFDVGTIEGADSQRAVHHELHIAGSGGLLTGGGDLLGQIGGRVDQLGVLDVEVGDERHPHPIVDFRIGIHSLRDGVDQLDDELGDVIPGRRLAAEDECSWGDLQTRVLLEPVIEGDDVQGVEVLALVLVNALNLDVEQPVRVQGDARRFHDVVRQPSLVPALDGPPALAEFRIAGQWFQGA